MNKIEYIQELKKHLRRLPKDDFKKAIDYFEEYFADAGVENETRVIEDLGSPEFAARQIITNIAIQNTKEPAGDIRKGFNALWVSILAVCAAPIALPLAFAVIIVIAAFIFSILLLILCFILVGVLLILAGPLCIVAGFTVMAQSIPSFISCIGMGLTSAGMGLLLTYGMLRLSRAVLTGTTRFFGHFISKRRQRNE